MLKKKMIIKSAAKKNIMRMPRTIRIMMDFFNLIRVLMYFAF